MAWVAASADFSRYPQALTSFVGRGEEVALLRDLLVDDRVRLLTVTGPGGVGKTRLVLETLPTVEDAFADGVAFVPLATVRDAHLILPAIAHACGLSETSNQLPIDHLVEGLGHRELLLVVDNFEHLRAESSQLGEIVNRCPGVQVVVTSRARLNLEAEHGFHLNPLAVPPEDGASTLSDLGDTESIDLFVQRAVTASPGFSLSEHNVETVSRICIRCDGLPLAIELAAARTRILSPDAILALLLHSLHGLGHGPDDQPERLRTMRSAIDWSYQLLDEGTKRLFRGLAIFVGGCDIDGASAVAVEETRPGSGVDPIQATAWAALPSPLVLDGMEALIDHNLVRRYDGVAGIPRFTMLETIREFGLEELAERGDFDAVALLHAEHCIRVAETGSTRLGGADQTVWLERLDADLPNVRMALGRLRERGDAATGLRLCNAAAWYWRVRGLIGEGRGWIEGFLAFDDQDELPRPILAAALRWCGELAGLQTLVVESDERLDASLRIYRELGDQRGVAGVLGAVGISLVQRGEAAASAAPFIEAAQLHRALGEHRRAVFLACYSALGMAHAGEFDRAMAVAVDGRGQAVALGDPASFEVAFADLIQGAVLVLMERYAEAQPALRSALDIARARASALIHSAAQGFLGRSHIQDGDEMAALDACADGVRMAMRVEYNAGIGFNVAGLLTLALRRADPTRVAHLRGVLDQLGNGYRACVSRSQDERLDDGVASSRQAMGAEAFDRHRRIAADLPLAVALAPVLEEVTTTRTALAGRDVAADDGVDLVVPLTPRQRAVLRGLIRGWTNTEIGEDLSISGRTVEDHVAQLTAKLGVTSRREAAAFALRHRVLDASPT